MKLLQAFSLPTHEFFVNKIKDCEKFAYILEHNLAYDTYLKLRQGSQRDNIVISKDVLENIGVAWTFMFAPIPQEDIELRFHSLIQSGIKEALQERHWSLLLRTEKVNEMRMKLEQVKSLTTKDNVIVLFYLYLAA